MTTLLIKNGHLVDPKHKKDEVLDILVCDGRVKKIGKNLSEKAEKVIDAKGKYVFPGIIDLQVHLREPGREDKETIETGLRAAINGGITSVVAMPNLNPVADNQATIGFQMRRAEQLCLANLFPTASITSGQKGERLTEMRECKLAGAIAVTDDGVDVQNAGLIEKAMEWAKTFGLLVMSHCEEESLHDHGVINEGEWSTRLGLPGVSTEVEDYGVFRNVLLAQKTGVQFHALHCSTAGGLDIIRRAKANHSNITCETCPQYFVFTDKVCEGYNTNAKMYPPIRDEFHQKAVIEALKDGTIDAISTDHAPHLESEKMAAFTDAPYGSVGLETSLSAGFSFLVKAGHLSISTLIEKMSTSPARILKQEERGHLGEGAIADITIFDPSVEWTVDPSKFESKGRNSLFAGMKLQGVATEVIVRGELKKEGGRVL
jgi:dihydroorotase